MVQFPQFACGLGLATVLAIATAAQANPVVFPSDRPFSTTVFNNSSILLFPPYRDLVEMPNNKDRSSRNYIYSLYQAGKLPLEVVVERDGDRLLLVERPLVGKRMLKKRKQALAAYQVVGLPSRVFPGLTGFQKIPPETVRSVSAGGEAAIAQDNEELLQPNPFLTQLSSNLFKPD